jgi:HD-like signal output (HDOD) protein
MSLDHATSARELAKLVQQVPSLPLTFQRINELVTNPRSSANQITEAVTADQGLATRILRLANSSFYGLSARIDTISQAVTIIGTRQLRDLALATAVLDLFKDVPNAALNGKAFWEHALAVGSATRLIAAKRGERETERHFVSGMLHDIGLVVMAQQMPDQVTAHVRAAETANQPLSMIERRDLGFDHAELGAHVIEHWRLPPSLIEVAAQHHQIMTTARYVHDCAMVHLADTMAEAYSLGSGGEPVVPPLDLPAWDVLGLTPTDLAPITSDMERQMTEISAIFLA